MKQATVIRIGAGLAFLGVGLGAFGAHGLEELLVENGRVDTWETAVLYHLVHAVALLALGLSPRLCTGTCLCFAGGTVLFSGSLYVLSLTNATKLGMITPLGGIAFLVGWGILLFGPKQDAQS